MILNILPKKLINYIGEFEELFWFFNWINAEFKKYEDNNDW